MTDISTAQIYKKVILCMWKYVHGEPRHSQLQITMRVTYTWKLVPLNVSIRSHYFRNIVVLP